jgi:hypothetical protein
MGENRNQREVIPRWRTQGALNLASEVHETPRKFDRLLPKFDLDKPVSPEDYINNLFLAIHLLGIQHEDAVCRLFPYTLSGKAFTWYFILPDGN